MAAVIRGTAAVDDIFKDLRQAHTDGLAKKGKIAEVVEAEIGPMVILVDTVEADLKQAKDVATPFVSAVKAANDEADHDLGRIYDDTWNDLGRPAHDRSLAVAWPGGIGFYADGIEGQPDRMELLAQLYERGILPRLTPEQVKAYAARIRDSAAPLAKALDAARIPTARVTLFERIRTALGRTAQFELTSLKRALQNAGYSETVIHSVIPDRSPPKKKGGGATGGTGPSGGATGASGATGSTGATGATGAGPTGPTVPTVGGGTGPVGPTGTSGGAG